MAVLGDFQPHWEALTPETRQAFDADAEALPMPQMIDQTPWQKMMRFLEEQAIQAGRKQLEDLWE